MDGHPIGTGSGVLARDVADPGNVGNAGDIVHAFLLESAADLRVAGACGADIVGDGVLAKAEKHNVVLSQLAPWHFSAKSPMNQKRTFRHVAFLTTRLAANMGARCSTKLLSNMSTPAAAADKRWLDGLYLDIPEEWDDPYRFFGW